MKDLLDRLRDRPVQWGTTVAEQVEIVLEAISGGLTVRDTFMVDIVFPDAVKDFAKVGMEIYPNPSSGTFVIGLDSPDTFDVTIISITGTPVYKHRKYISGQSIDISSLTAGAYIIRITMDSGSISKMIHKL